MKYIVALASTAFVLFLTGCGYDAEHKECSKRATDVFKNMVKNATETRDAELGKCDAAAKAKTTVPPPATSAPVTEKLKK